MLLVCILLLMPWGTALAQTVPGPDPDYNPPIPNPAYAQGKGPVVALDEAHHNYHTAEGRYKSFVRLLIQDGYRVIGLHEAFSEKALERVDVLVISNALSKEKVSVESWWIPPSPSAFTTEEVTALANWVKRGGSLLLIVDHMPFPSSAKKLTEAFGLKFHDGYVYPGHHAPEKPSIFDAATGLKPSAVTRGRNEKERVDRVMTFTGSAFKAPPGARPVIVLGEGSLSYVPGPDTTELFKAPATPVKGWWQGAIIQVEKGRLAVFGEAAMFTSQRITSPEVMVWGMSTPGAEQNHQLLLNVMHWLSRVEGMPD